MWTAKSFCMVRGSVKRLEKVHAVEFFFSSITFLLESLDPGEDEDELVVLFIWQKKETNKKTLSSVTELSVYYTLCPF